MALIRLTSNVFVQDELTNPDRAGVMSWADVKAAPASDVTRFSHVVNWYQGDEAAMALQAATARTIREAAHSVSDIGTGCSWFPRVLTRAVSGRRVIRSASMPRLIACVAEGEAAAVPPGFKSGRPLRRTVLDCGTFNVPRPLPLLFDILESGSAAADPQGFLVFTNADICLLPHFYRSIQVLLSRGFDCLVINRRTVGALSAYGEGREIAMFEAGSLHPGLDCFVFPVSWAAGFARSNACVGAGWVMRSLLYNLVARSERMLIMREAHLTYHFGDDQIWAQDKLADYVSFNRDQARSVLATLCRQERNRGILAGFCQAHPEPFDPASL